jgi:methylated-DNA-[protein]-cysteine S-methyltransferase
VRERDSKISYGYFDSPVGPLLVAGDADQLHLISFPTERRTKETQADWQRDESRFAEAFRQLRAYFAGELTRFDLPLRLAGTAFQNKVWIALCDIPFGETISYGALASRIGKPTASRAVGGANGANPLPIVVPCHRVIGSDRSLTGFGGGVETKRFLLAHEQRVSPGKGSQSNLPI